MHSSFREYLMAEYIDGRHFSSKPADYWEEIWEHLEDPRWREVILFLLSIVDEDYGTFLVEKILTEGWARTGRGSPCSPLWQSNVPPGCLLIHILSDVAGTALIKEAYMGYPQPRKRTILQADKLAHFCRHVTG